MSLMTNVKTNYNHLNYNDGWDSFIRLAIINHSNWENGKQNIEIYSKKYI
jgi:hypothetical protein